MEWIAARRPAGGLLLAIACGLAACNTGGRDAVGASAAATPVVPAVVDSPAPENDAAMVLVPEGVFWMGTDARHPESLPNEQPARLVFVDAYRIDRLEVSNARYEGLLRASGRRSPAYWHDDRFNGPTQPVVGVGWEDADAYCRWAGKRLPTEAEWEKAARGSDRRQYPWGDAWEARRASSAERGLQQPMPVGAFADGASPFGVLDLAGNVWEWTSDWYGDNPSWRLAALRNPKGPESGSQKVVRGGSWDGYPYHLRASFRLNLLPRWRRPNVGFRCAKSVPPRARPALLAADPIPEAPIVSAALAALVERHVGRPDAVGLLAAGLDGIRTRLGAEATPLLEPLSAIDANAAAREFASRYGVALAHAPEGIEAAELEYAAVCEMGRRLRDSHTGCLRPQARRAKREALAGHPSYVGVGVTPISRSDRIYIWHVAPGGPAAGAGLRRFDRLAAIDGVAVSGMSPAAVGDRVRGTAGTTVRLTIQRPGGGDPFVIPIVRAAVTWPPLELAMLEGGIGHARLRSFQTGASKQVREGLERLAQDGATGVVLDLRNNDGGWIKELAAIAHMLLPAGPTEGHTVYWLETRDGPRRLGAGGVPLPAPPPLVVLVNQLTRSSAEFLAAALQYHRQAPVVGVRSAGAGGIADEFDLPGGGAMDVMVGRVHAPSGVALEGSGVTPDVSVDVTAEDLDRGVDVQLQRAVELLHAAPPR